MQSASVCPYCGKALEKAPSRKTKCPHCGNYIYVRQGRLLTERQINAPAQVTPVAPKPPLYAAAPTIRVTTKPDANNSKVVVLLVLLLVMLAFGYSIYLWGQQPAPAIVYVTFTPEFKTVGPLRTAKSQAIDDPLYTRTPADAITSSGNAGPTSAPISQPTSAPAAQPTTASNGPTALCKDGTYSYAANHKGACSHHGGVSVWYK